MKALAQQLMLMAVSILVTLVIADLAYRWWVQDVVPRSVGRFDETLGWALRPNSSGTSDATGTVVRYSINGKGLRDDETDYAKPPGVFRIVLLGDSRTFGYGVAIEQHFSKLLEGYFDKVEVINMGVSGYGVDQELLALRGEGLRYQPDLVIAYVSHFGAGRHMFAERWGKPKPQFKLQNGALVLTNVPIPSEYLPDMDFPHRVDWFLVEHSPLYRDLSQVAIGLFKKAIGRDAAEQGAAPADAPSDPVFVDRMYEMGIAILQQLNRESAAAGAHFVLVTELERLHDECSKLGMTSFNVSVPLRNPRFALPHGLQHINEAGNGVLAWELAQFLTRKGLIPASHEPKIVPAEAKS